MPGPDRPLTPDELTLVRWLLENSRPDAKDYLPQLAVARVAPYVCPCGCGSLEFSVPGYEPQPGPEGMHVLADYFTDADACPRTVMLYAGRGVLAGLEITVFDGTPPATPPAPHTLRPNEFFPTSTPATTAPQ